MADNPFQTYSQSVTAPAVDAFPITPNDSTDLTQAVRALYVGGAGDVNLITGNLVTSIARSRARSRSNASRP